MPTLSPVTDHVVRHAVDAFLAGHRHGHANGELCFATRNHRYRLVDGVLFSVNLASGGEERGARELLGAEFVGWLHKDRTGTRVEGAWRAGVRGVMVDPRRRQHIIITSATFSATQEAGSRPTQAGSGVTHTSAIVPPIPPPPRVPTMTEGHAPVQRGDEPALRSVSYRPVHPPPRPIRRTEPSSSQVMRYVPSPTPPPRRSASAVVQGMRLR